MSLVLICRESELSKRVLLCLVFISCSDRLYISLMPQVVVALPPWSMLKHCQSSSKRHEVTVKQLNGSEIISGSLRIPVWQHIPTEALPAQQGRFLQPQHSQPTWQQVSVALGALGQAWAQGPAAWVLSSIPRQLSAQRGAPTQTTIQATPS